MQPKTLTRREYGTMVKIYLQNIRKNPCRIPTKPTEK